MRVFIALEIPKKIKRELGKIQNQLKKTEIPVR